MSVDCLLAGLSNCDAAHLLIKTSRPRPPELFRTLWRRENDGLLPRIERFLDCPDIIPTKVSQLHRQIYSHLDEISKEAWLEFSKRHVRQFLVCPISDVRSSFESTGFIAAYPIVVVRSMLEQFKCCWKIVFDTVSVPGSKWLVICLFHQGRSWHILSVALGAVCSPFWIPFRVAAHERIPKGVFRI